MEILRSKGDGYADRGDENQDLGIQENDMRSLSQSRRTGSISNNREDSPISVPGSSDGGGGLYNLLYTESTSAQQGPHNATLRPSSPSALQQPATTIGTATSAHPYFSQYQRQESPIQQQGQLDLLYSFSSAPNNGVTQNQQSLVPDEQESLEVCRPFFDPTMLDLFPNGEMPDLSHFETSLLNVDYFELGDGDGDWNLGPNLVDETCGS